MQQASAVAGGSSNLVQGVWYRGVCFLHVQVQWWCQLHAGLGQAGRVQAGSTTEQPRTAVTCQVCDTKHDIMQLSIA